MIKRMVPAALLTLLLAGAALAQAPAPTDSKPAEAQAEKPATPDSMTGVPASLEDCISSATQLGQLAEAKSIPDAQIDKLDELFTKLESLCDARQFSEAAAIATDIKTMLDGQ